MDSIVKVALNLPLYTAFDYSIPSTLSNIKPGVRVVVNFSSKTMVGVVIRKNYKNEDTKTAYKIKEIDKVIDEEPIIVKDILKLSYWAAEYYQHPIGQVIFSTIPSSLKLGKKLEVIQTAEEKINLLKKVKLNDSQNLIYQSIKKNLNIFSPSLIEGVTGSGKTEIYIKLAQKIINMKGQVLIVVPEINLTPQTLQRFKTYLAGEIYEYHSSLSEKIKTDTWQKCKSGEINIIIGTRSSVFLPFQNLRMIIVDEEHDVSLKQSEKFKYHARDLAVLRAKHSNIPIILGSATPSFESLYNCKKNKYKHYVLKTRFYNSKLPSVKVVDINTDTTTEGFSYTLIKSIEENLKEKKQVLLFVNRRGFSHTLLCKTCGWMSKCSNCDAYMTFHKFENKLYCHHCGNQKKINPKKICSNDNCEIIALGVGTERIEKQANKLFPNHKIMRIDSDTITTPKKLKKFLDKAHSGEIDILIGTQMLVKGHDFPNLNLVGIIDIDAGLHSVDFRGIEKISQMIIQVAGRSGRHTNQGQVVIQTRKPNHPLMTKLLNNGYNSFSNDALDERYNSSLPPYSYLTLFRASSMNKLDGLSFLARIKREFDGNNFRILGPAAAPILKKSNRFIYQLLINTNNRKLLLQKTSEIREYITKQKKSSIRWSIDVDPIDLY